MQFLPQPQLKFDCEPFRGCQIPYQTDSEDFLQFVPNCTKPCKSIPHTPTVTVFWQKLICALDQLQSRCLMRQPSCSVVVRNAIL